MCSSRGLCGSDGRSSRQSSSGNGSGAHYALCALGVGLIALGIVMIVWTVIPMDGEGAGSSAPKKDNSSASVPNGNSDGGGDDDDERQDAAKSSTVAMVLVAVGAVLLLLSICLGVRNKRRARNTSSVPVATAAALMDHVAGQQEDP